MLRSVKLADALLKLAQRMWIQRAIENKGSLREAAAREGGIDQRTGKIKKTWIKQELEELKQEAEGAKKLSPAKLKRLRRLNLALTLMRLAKRKKKR